MNVALALKSEITRVARKELKSDTKQLKKSASQHRAEIASMKRRIKELEKAVKALVTRQSGSAAFSEPLPESVRYRFSPNGLKARRGYLGISAEQMGALIGVSGQSIYKWEQSKTVPRATQLPAIRAVLKLGKREASVKLAAD